MLCSVTHVDCSVSTFCRTSTPSFPACHGLSCAPTPGAVPRDISCWLIILATHSGCFWQMGTSGFSINIRSHSVKL